MLRRAGRALAALSALVLSVWVASAAAVVVWSHRDEARPAAAIVVLGAAQYAGHPSPVLRARLDHGIALWRAGLAPVLVLTGGRGVGDTTSEAEVGAAFAQRDGVPASALLTETHSRTTVESMRAVAALLRARGAADAVLVSDPFHMLRLSLLADRFGIVAYTSPTRTSPISARPEAAWRYVLSESVKVPITWVFVHNSLDNDR